MLVGASSTGNLHLVYLHYILCMSKSGLTPVWPHEAISSRGRSVPLECSYKTAMILHQSEWLNALAVAWIQRTGATVGTSVPFHPHWPPEAVLPALDDMLCPVTPSLHDGTEPMATLANQSALCLPGDRERTHWPDTLTILCLCHLSTRQKAEHPSLPWAQGQASPEQVQRQCRGLWTRGNKHWTSLPVAVGEEIEPLP